MLICRRDRIGRVALLTCLHLVLLHSAYSAQNDPLDVLNDDDRKPLLVAGLFPMSGGWAGGIGCLPAVRMAFEDVNADPNLLPGYKLQLISQDSQCVPGLSLHRMYDLLYDNNTKLVLMTGCSSVSTFIAQAAKMWNLIVLGYGSSSPALSDRNRFPTFFRTHPSATLHNPTRVRLFKRFGWNRIATIQQTEELFTTTIKDLEAAIKKENNQIEIAVRQSFQTDPTNAVKSLKRQDARIIVGVFYEDMARRVFCQVYHNKLYGKEYVWLIIGWYADGWYKKQDDAIDCTPEQMELAVEGHLTTEVVQYNLDLEKITDTGITANAFEDRLKKALENVTGDHTSFTQIAGYVEAPLAYDAVWALSFALNKTINVLQKRDPSTKRLEDFSYEDEDIKNEIFASLNQTDFEGVSGRVSFTSTGDRIAKTQIEQMQGGKYTKIGYYNYINDQLDWTYKDVWPGGQAPPDRTMIEDKLLRIATPLSFTMISLSAFGVLGCLVSLAFNVCSLNYSVVKNSQPKMNNLVIIGCTISLACVPLFGIDGLTMNTHVQLCQARKWLLSLGFTLSFGTMFAKIFYSWRIAKVFKEKKGDAVAATKVIDDSEATVAIWEPYCLLTAFLVIDGILLGVWQGVDPLGRLRVDFPLEKPTVDDERDILYRPFLEHCTSNTMSVWFGLLYGYKGCLLVAGLFLAYEIRSVKILRVNDLRFVAMAVYNVVVLCLIAVPVTLIIPNQQNASFSFVAVAIILSCYLTIGLLFIPKMIMLATKRLDMNEEETQLSLMHHETQKRYKELMSRNDHLKLEIANKESKIRELHAVLQMKFVQELADESAHSDSAFSEDGSNVEKHQEISDASTSSGFQTANQIEQTNLIPDQLNA